MDPQPSDGEVPSENVSQLLNSIPESSSTTNSDTASASPITSPSFPSSTTATPSPSRWNTHPHLRPSSAPVYTSDPLTLHIGSSNSLPDEDRHLHFDNSEHGSMESDERRKSNAPTAELWLDGALADHKREFPAISYSDDVRDPINHVKPRDDDQQDLDEERGGIEAAEKAEVVEKAAAAEAEAAGSPGVSTVPYNDLGSKGGGAPEAAEDGRKRTIRFTAENEVHHITQSPEEFEDNLWTRTNKCSRTARLRSFLCVYVLAFTYGVTIRTTDLFFLIEMLGRHRGIGVYQAGAWLAAAYGVRIFMASMVRWAPKTVVLLGTLIAASAFWALLLAELMRENKDQQIPTLSKTLFIMGSLGVGGNEILGALQRFVKDQYTNNLKDMGWYLGQQWYVLQLGEMCSFASCGAIYYFQGIKGVVAQGCVFMAMQLLFLLLYILLDNCRELHDDDPLWSMMGSSRRKSLNPFARFCPEFRMQLSPRASSGKRRVFTSELSEIHRSLLRYYPYKGLLPNVIRFVLPYANAAVSVTQPCVWCIAAYILHQDFNIDPFVTGLVFSGGVLIRIIATAALFSERIHRSVLGCCPNPRLLIFSMAGMALSILLMAVPLVYVFVLGFVLYTFFSAILWILVTEIQGNGSNTCESPTARGARRLLTAACLFTLPNLHKIYSPLPSLLAFWVALVAGIVVLVKVCWRRGRSDDEVDEQTSRGHRSSSRNGRGAAARGNKQEQNLVYAQQIMLTWLIKGNDL